MKKLIIATVIALLAITGLVSQTRAEPNAPEAVTPDAALTVCKNWVTLITQKTGTWGGAKTAQVQGVQEFKRGQRVLGYFCAVKPQGYIVVSLRQELEPVKAYSATSNLNPELDLGMTDLIKGGMERIVDTIEQRLGPIRSVRTQDLSTLLQSNYRSTWNQLTGNPVTFRQALASKQVTMNYQGGQLLLSSHWNQGIPYNVLTPPGNTACGICPPPYTGSPTFPSLVGCVATAGAQIMRYWAWPPYGVGSSSYFWEGDNSCGGNVGGGTLSATYSDTYDWRNMPDWISSGSPPVQKDAVQELSFEVGVAVKMDYGVCASGAFDNDMRDAYEQHFRYASAAVIRKRKDYNSRTDWFNHMKIQFNANRPIQYGIKRHSLVADGWQEVGSGTDCDNGILCQIHMNYGQPGGSRDDWYAVDSLYQLDPTGTFNDEAILEDIYPAQALGNSPSGTYARDASFPYRYFDQDATSDRATFQSGQLLQFPPDVSVTDLSTWGGATRFESSASDTTWLFTQGDPSRGVRISGGAVKLNNYGSITFSPLGAPTNVSAEALTGGIRITWQQGLGSEDGFEIERKTMSGSYAVIGSTGANATVYDDNPGVHGQRYSYRVRAKRGGAFSAYSNEVEIFFF